MTALNFKTIIIGLASSLLMISVAHGKCYPGLDCPEDLPNANNTSNQPVPTPSTRQQTPEPTPEPATESTAPPEESRPVEPQTVDKTVGWKVPTDSTTEESNSAPEESPSLTKYGKYDKHEKYGKYPK